MARGITPRTAGPVQTADNKAVHGHTPRCRWLDHWKAGRNTVSPQILKFVDSGPRPLKQVRTSTSGGFFDVSYFQMVRCRHAASQSSFSARSPTCLHNESRESNIFAESTRWTLVHSGKSLKCSSSTRGQAQNCSCSGGELCRWLQSSGSCVVHSRRPDAV